MPAIKFGRLTSEWIAKGRPSIRKKKHARKPYWTENRILAALNRLNGKEFKFERR